MCFLSKDQCLESLLWTFDSQMQVSQQNIQLILHKVNMWFFKNKILIMLIERTVLYCLRFYLLLGGGDCIKLLVL